MRDRPKNEGPADVSASSRPERENRYLAKHTAPRSRQEPGTSHALRRRGPWPDRPLRAFAGWPEGLEAFLSIGSPAGPGGRS